MSPDSTKHLSQPMLTAVRSYSVYLSSGIRRSEFTHQLNKIGNCIFEFGIYISQRQKRYANPPKCNLSLYAIHLQVHPFSRALRTQVNGDWKRLLVFGIPQAVQIALRLQCKFRIPAEICENMCHISWTTTFCFKIRIVSTHVQVIVHEYGRGIFRNASINYTNTELLGLGIILIHHHLMRTPCTLLASTYLQYIR